MYSTGLHGSADFAHVRTGQRVVVRPVDEPEQVVVKIQFAGQSATSESETVTTSRGPGRNKRVRRDERTSDATTHQFSYDSKLSGGMVTSSMLDRCDPAGPQYEATTGLSA
jgi:hypothetical protein